MMLQGSSMDEAPCYWPMDGNTNDLSPYKLHGHSAETLRYVGSYVGLGLKLPGKGVTLKDTGKRLILKNGFTIEAWVRWESGAVGSCIIYEKENSYALGIEYGIPFISCNNKKWKPVDLKLEAGKWYFIAATFDGKKLKLYINGKETDGHAQPCALEEGIQITIGKSSNQFKGILDEVKIYDRELSSQTILGHYQAVPRVSAIWSLDNDTLDKSGLGHHGKTINGTEYKKGRINHCLYFDGNNDYALFSNEKQLLDPGMNISIEAWIYCFSFKKDWRHIFDKYRSWSLSVKNGRLAMSGRGGWWYLKNTGLKTHTWYHVAATYSLNERKLYINGKLMGRQWVHTGAKYGDAVYLSSPYFPFHGLIDEVKLYNDTLSQKDVITRYEANVP